MCYILTLIPSSLRYCFKSLIRISPKWKTLAAKAASAFPLENYPGNVPSFRHHRKQ